MTAALPHSLSSGEAERMERNGEKRIENISGEVIDVIHANESTGYSVLEVEKEDDGERVTVVGYIPFPGPGEYVTAEGWYEMHSRFGTQFKCRNIDRELPSSATAIMNYLASGVVKGIGKVTASKIVAKFGDETFDVIENQPELLTAIKGITPARARELSAEFTTKLAIKDLMTYMSEYELAPSLAYQVYRNYGGASIDVITRNPYLLALAPFFADFVKVDNMALSMGFAPDDAVRMEAGAVFELYYNQNEGHVFLPFENLCTATAQLLNLPEDRVKQAAAEAADKKIIVREQASGCDACYLTYLYDAEKRTAERLAFFASLNFEMPPGIDEIISAVEKQQGIQYDEKQLEAIRAAVSLPVMVLTGGPGTGKTTAVRGILAVMDYIGAKTALAAPTGRAAKRLSELCGREAKTIHRLLEVNFGKDGTSFVHNQEDPLNADAVIIDEMSMVDLVLMDALLSAMKRGSRIILVGDPDQLPSVGPGTVLRDIINSGVIKNVHLEKIFRQALESDIVLNAHAVNRGELPALKNNKKDFFFMNREGDEAVARTVVELCSMRLPKNMGYDRSEIQVISPSRRLSCGVETLNPLLQASLNPPAPDKKERRFGDVVFREHDRVMQIKNNYDLPWQKPESDEIGLGVFNGDIGVIQRIDYQSQTVSVQYDDKVYAYGFDMLGELEHAYAITVHKAQGSEFRAVVFVASLRQSRLLNRSLFYTAITRAKDMLVIVGNPESVETMVANKRKMKRLSALKERIIAEAENEKNRRTGENRQIPL